MKTLEDLLREVDPSLYDEGTMTVEEFLEETKDLDPYDYDLEA